MKGKKLNALAGAAVLGLGLTTISAPAQADACKVVICMYGELVGESGGSECNGALAEYFGIIKFDWKGSFDPGKTSDARKDRMQSCPGADAGAVNKITGKFGRLFSYGGFGGFGAF